MQQHAWAHLEAQHATVPDQRYRRVVAETLAATLTQTQVSFSQACGSALRQAAGRLVRCEQTEPNDLLAGHRQATLQRCLEQHALGTDMIVVAQDSTSYNYGGHTATTGLGPVNDQAKALGLHQHSALAMTPQKLPLGVVFAKFWVRSKTKGSAATRRSRPITQKESFKWLEASSQVEAALLPYLEAGGRVVLVEDREADIFDVLAQPRHAGMDLVVRAAQARSVQVQGLEGSDFVSDGSLPCSLLAAAKGGSVLGEYPVSVPARAGVPAREARMQLRSVAVRVSAPEQGVGSAHEPVVMWVVHAQELAPLERVPSKPSLLSWTLITSLPAAAYEGARRVVSLYTCRWEIERLHYTLKSGCQAEKLQMDDAPTLCNVLALYVIVAWRLLFVTHVARVTPEAACVQVVDATEQAVLCQVTGQAVMSVSDALRAIARLGGHEAYVNGPPAGVKTVWLGLRKLEAMAQGWRLAMAAIRLEKR